MVVMTITVKDVISNESDGLEFWAVAHHDKSMAWILIHQMLLIKPIRENLCFLIFQIAFSITKGMIHIHRYLVWILSSRMRQRENESRLY